MNIADMCIRLHYMCEEPGPIEDIMDFVCLQQAGKPKVIDGALDPEGTAAALLDISRSEARRRNAQKFGPFDTISRLKWGVLKMGKKDYTPFLCEV